MCIFLIQVKKMSMKYLLMTACIAVGTFFSNAQNLPVNEKTGKITYMEVLKTEGVSSEDVHEEAKKWADAHKGWELIEEVDGEKLVYEVDMPIFYPSADGKGQSEGVVSYTYSIFTKDGRYRYIVTDFEHAGKERGHDGGKLENVSPACSKSKISGRGWVSIKNKTNADISKLNNDLKQTIKEFKNDPANDDDW